MVQYHCKALSEEKISCTSQGVLTLLWFNFTAIRCSGSLLFSEKGSKCGSEGPELWLN